MGSIITRLSKTGRIMSCSLSICPSICPSKQIGTSELNVWVSLMYFKWDLFRRHTKNGFMRLKMGLSGYFFAWERHISIKMLGHPSVRANK